MSGYGGRRAMWGAAIGAAIATAACGGNVVVDAGAARGAGGGASTTTTTGTPTIATTTSTTSTTTTTITQTGAGGAANACDVVTHDAIAIALTLPTGDAIACAGGASHTYGEIQVTGRVTGVRPDGFDVDACPPNADCIPEVYAIGLGGSAPPFVVHPAALVHVHFAAIDGDDVCSARVVVTNVPAWAGLENPVRGDAALWLAAADGSLATFDDAPFTVEPVSLACGALTGDTYLLRVRLRDPHADQHVDAFMGRDVFLTPQIGPPGETWRVHDLRSFDPGVVGKPPQFGYWITQEPGLD